MSIIVQAKKINIHSKTVKMVNEHVVMEAPVNIYVNDNYVITLLATPEFKKELVLGWLFDEGVLQSFDEVTEIIDNQDIFNVKTKDPIEEEKLRVVSVSRLLTTACGLSASKFFDTISEVSNRYVKSNYKVKASNIIQMMQKIDKGKLFRSTGGVHVAALFTEGEFIALAEDIGRHNSIDKVVGIGILKNINFANSILVSSGRQPADMVLKAVRMGIPIIASRAAPIRSGIIAAEKNGVTLVCFVREQRMNIYTHPNRILF
ncbi:formate dehydrogenase accessory sulfurtransferase FdhD [Candidatus Bathyarchaeota archaeon]|nr:formate dehydrogenase accessory sulfurtransferase FdhD [Candidatus Bathyarchaeota archaeon]